MSIAAKKVRKILLKKRVKKRIKRLGALRRGVKMVRGVKKTPGVKKVLGKAMATKVLNKAVLGVAMHVVPVRTVATRGALRLLERHTPGVLKSVETQILLNLTARAFHVPKKRVWNLPEKKALQEYARFTVSCMNEHRANPQTLYREAYLVGRLIRKVCGFKNKKDAQRLVFYLYRNIDITMRGSLPGEVTVPQCYFAKIYTPAQCAIMSAVDSGIIAGICGGGKLKFTQRLTEGCAECKACLTH